MTSVDLDANLWPHFRTALASVNLLEVDITGELGMNIAFFFRHPANTVIIQSSIRKLTLNSSAFLEGVRLPSLTELDVDMGFCGRAAPKEPTPASLSVALVQSACHLTALRIRQDTLPLHIANPVLNNHFATLQILIIDFQDNRLTPIGLGRQEYDNVVVAFADTLGITSGNHILPVLKYAQLNVLTCFEFIRPRIRTIRAIVAMLASRVDSMMVFGIHGHGGVGRRDGTATVLSRALPRVDIVDDLIYFRGINVEFTSNGQDILA